MAPELFDERPPTFATDVYSLGIVLWEIASHRLPYQQSKWKPHELMTQILHGTRENFPPETPPMYEALAKRCWDKDPKKRPIAEEAAQTLVKLSKEDPFYEKGRDTPFADQKTSYLEGTASPVSAESVPYNVETKIGISGSL